MLCLCVFFYLTKLMCVFPRSGGDTEVDVNDVSYSLEKVIEQRKAEDTWQIDTFGGVSAAPIRPPDEVWPFFWFVGG